MKITKLIDVLMAVKKITGEILGGCDDLLLALLIFMAIEYITCTLAGIYNKKIKEITLDKIIKKIMYYPFGSSWQCNRFADFSERQCDPHSSSFLLHFQ